MDASGILLLVIVGILFVAALVRFLNGASNSKSASNFDSNIDYYNRQDVINRQIIHDQVQTQQDFGPDQQSQIDQQNSHYQSIDTSGFDTPGSVDTSSFPDSPMTDSSSSAGSDSTNY